MPNRGVTKILGSEPKSAATNVILVANAMVWYLCAFMFLQDTALASNISDFSFLVIVMVNFLALMLSALLGTFSLNKFKSRMAFIKYWMLAGVIISALLVVIDLHSFTNLIITGGILGAYFGIGMPAFMGYFSATTKPENRARIGGVIIFLMGLCLPIIASIGKANIFLNLGTLALWRLSGLILIILLKSPETSIDMDKKESYRSVLSNKSFLLYLIPWFMFSLINEFTNPISAQYLGNTNIFSSALADNYSIVGQVLAGVSALACGFLADKNGRKRIALIGFILVGLGYASLGLFSGNYLAAWFHVCVDGIAWGAFCMLFIITIWGDIAQGRSSEKYYIIGFLPYLLSNFMRFSIGTYIAENIVLESTVFSFASFFLFVAILPLTYAPETLSDKILKSLDLNNYVNKALEVVKERDRKK